MSRFTEATSTEAELIENIIKESFVELSGARFIILYDEKKRKSKGQYVVGRIKKLNDESKALSLDENGNEFNYVVFLDSFVWGQLESGDQERLMRRLICQCLFESEAEDPFKIQGFEVEDFHSEIVKNTGDPRWLDRVNLIAESLYDEDTMPVEEL